MYDRRPASRAARGTPTVAAVTPVVRGSFHSAIVTPCRAGERPVRYCRYIVDARGDFKRIRIIAGFRWSSVTERRINAIAPGRGRCDSAAMSTGVAAAPLRRLV